MRGLFKRKPAVVAPDTSALGGAMLALRVASGVTVPQACVGVAFDKSARARRFAPGERIAFDDAHSSFCFHPGPYSVDLTPFAAAPELGLRLGFVVDAPDPRVTQQRFDLYLASEGGQEVSIASIVAAIQSALQRELAQGHLDLPPCTTLAEWNSFRAGLNQLLYTRFGVTVEDCVPVDLGESVDYAQMLRARALPAATARAAEIVHPAPAAFDAAQVDALALRRLFLELPGVTCALRLAVLPPGQQLFRQHQDLLQRLGRVILTIATMPALALLAPGQSLAHDQIKARAEHSSAALGALDEAWALAARLAIAPAAQLAGIFDDADRVVANLEYHSAGRHSAMPASDA